MHIHGPAVDPESAEALAVQRIDVAETEAGSVRLDVKVEGGRSLWLTVPRAVGIVLGDAVTATARRMEAAGR
jgi:hypothetical protein